MRCNVSANAPINVVCKNFLKPLGIPAVLLEKFLSLLADKTRILATIQPGNITIDFLAAIIFVQRFEAQFLLCLAVLGSLCFLAALPCVAGLEILRHGGRTVQELQQSLQLDQAIVSQHLARLRAKNVVEARKDGMTMRYTVRDPAVGELLDVARQIFGRHLEGTQNMLRELQREQRVTRRR